MVVYHATSAPTSLRHSMSGGGAPGGMRMTNGWGNPASSVSIVRWVIERFLRDISFNVLFLYVERLAFTGWTSSGRTEPLYFSSLRLLFLTAQDGATTSLYLIQLSFHFSPFSGMRPESMRFPANDFAVRNLVAAAIMEHLYQKSLQ